MVTEEIARKFRRHFEQKKNKAKICKFCEMQLKRCLEEHLHFLMLITSDLGSNIKLQPVEN